MKRRTILKCQRSFAWLALAGLAAATLVASCSRAPSRYSQTDDGSPPERIDLSSIPDAVPKTEPLSKYGNPESYEIDGRRYYTLASSKGYKARGTASWYGTKFHGYRTSSGDIYDMYQMTAAHKTLPLPTYARVTNLDNGRSVIVKINDRGPFHSDRLIDLSYAAAAKLGLLHNGTGRVEVEALDARPEPPPQTQVAAAIPASKPKFAGDTAPTANATTATPAPKGAVKNGPSRAQPANAAAAGAAAAKASAGSATNATKPAQTAAASAAKPPAGSATGAAKPAPTATASAKNRALYVQAGSFKDRANAQRLQDSLTSSRFEGVSISEGTSNQRTVYRVRIGPVADVQAAESLSRMLQDQGITQSPHIVTD